jgi:hypothetical protein
MKSKINPFKISFTDSSYIKKDSIKEIDSTIINNGGNINEWFEIDPRVLDLEIKIQDMVKKKYFIGNRKPNELDINERILNFQILDIQIAFDYNNNQCLNYEEAELKYKELEEEWKISKKNKKKDVFEALIDFNQSKISYLLNKSNILSSNSNPSIIKTSSFEARIWENIFLLEEKYNRELFERKQKDIFEENTFELTQFFNKRKNILKKSIEKQNIEEPTINEKINYMNYIYDEIINIYKKTSMYYNTQNLKLKEEETLYTMATEFYQNVFNEEFKVLEKLDFIKIENDSIITDINLIIPFHSFEETPKKEMEKQHIFAELQTILNKAKNKGVLNKIPLFIEEYLKDNKEQQTMNKEEHINKKDKNHANIK